MAYVALAKIKKNSPPAALTSDITNSTGTFPVDHLEYFHDADGVLIVDGIVIWDPADPDPTHREEVKITAASGTTGAGNLTGGTRGVNADGTNGAARAFSSGAKIAVQFTTGKMNQIAGNFAAHETAIAGKATDSAVFHKATAGEIAGLSSKGTPTTSDILLIEDAADSNNKKKISIGNLPPSGLSLWTSLVATTDFATTGASTSTITMNTDKTASIPVGSPIKYTYNGTLYYGKITALTSSLMTIAGPPIGTGAGLLTTLSYGDASRIETRTYVIAGAYADAANTSLLDTDARMHGGEIWGGPVAYAVAFSVIHEQNDTGATQPTVTPTIAGSDLGTALSVSTTISKSVVGITAANYVVNKDSAIDIHTTAGTNGNAYDLTVEIDFVKP